MSKKISTAAVLALLTALPMSFVTVPAFAQAKDDLSRVEVQGKAMPAVTRFDVQAACPGIAQSLQDSLGVIAYREGSIGTVRVSFQLNGTELDEVKASGGPLEYRHATRRAVRLLDCQIASNQAQHYRFLVSFNSPEQAASTGRTVALLMVP